jgi:plasmid stabilization system protein ParE
MEGTEAFQVNISEQFNLDLEEVYQYGLETFGLAQAERYENEIWQLIEGLSTNYLLFLECHHLITKSKMYRWIILDAHLIIYRVSKNRIQVLRLIHAKRSITKIRKSRNIRTNI